MVDSESIIVSTVLNLMQAQNRAGMSYINMASDADVSIAFLYKLMSGDIKNPRVDTIERLFRALTGYAPKLVVDRTHPAPVYNVAQQEKQTND